MFCFKSIRKIDKKVIMKNKYKTHSSKAKFYDALLLDAHTNQALVAIRSLGKKGLRVAAIGESGRNIPAFHSKWCTQAFICPAKEGTENYANFLLEFIKNNKVGVIFSASDGTITMLQKYRKEVSKYTTIALGSEKALGIAIDKPKTLLAAKKVGLKIPQSYPVSKKEDIPAAIKKLQLPAVVKPTASWTRNIKGAKRVAPELAMTLQETYKLFDDLTTYGGETIFQEYLPGRIEAVSLLYFHGKFYAEYAQWTKRSQPPFGGTAVVRQSISVPHDSGTAAKALIKEINLEGYSQVEFRRDRNGVPCLMEINPRFNFSISLACDSGFDIPYLTYLLTVGKKNILPISYKAGVWERYLAGDIINMVESLKQRGRPGVPSPKKVIFDFVSTFFKPMHYDYFDLSDWKPAWSAITDCGVRNVKKLFVKNN